MNSHQVDAALFAFRSPLLRGAILADEVGPGKTIEAGIPLSQKWPERKRKVLIIVPANLRKQWSQELADNFFYLPAFWKQVRSTSFVIFSCQFAQAKEAYLKRVPWDLAVIDEAHRLRSIYKSSNRAIYH